MPAIATRPRAAAVATSGDPAPLVDINWIHTDLFRGLVGRDRLREALAAPKAPRPVLGGAPRAKAMWGRVAVIEYFEGIARSGKWPVAQKEAA